MRNFERNIEMKLNFDSDKESNFFRFIIYLSRFEAEDRLFLFFVNFYLKN